MSYGRRPMADSPPFSVREMPDGIHQSRQRETLIRLPIGELSAWNLLCSCGPCRADRLVMVGDLVARYGSERTLVVLVPRLRCGTCRRPPSDVVLRNKYPAQMGGSGFVQVILRAER